MWFTIYSYYYDKQDDIDNIFDEKNVPLSTKFDHPAFIEEWRQNIDAAAYEKNKTKE